ncbi:hypothetical protein TBLA_0D02490 [Henningerozyma blattae CBS 6284]|uniref:Serine hydroxymethyltransferase n=1 Tax=Henningerozyma blattae (strain ATCC 34711 / CBS 6284 / DSM 70876 / NBRC 10599 / NRRL Y-10934 / UCD 77-7) TaxID=1071380 RepID=I2H300_HENB6|nr:hypothetical protein TBLA_0D02490 [Tetrapisispora blattae CBS 6284]CCH60752.1 hypothetical protein TBLA_0D02490 [Tetrapisispora blattae CBS 6284]
MNVNYALSKEHKAMMSSHLNQTDPELEFMIKKEIYRQQSSIDLIASENCTSTSVLDALGTPLLNKYSEGYPGTRYYGGNEYIDEIELLCQKRALIAFRLDPKKWGVNVQALSGSPANLEVYQAIMKPHDRLMGLYLPDGGHLSHGYFTENRKISAVAIYFESFPYRLDQTTGLIDYDALEQNALIYRPKVIVSGPTSYCRLIDYKRLKKIADKCNAYLMVDMSHISGLVAGGVIPSPFDYADIVTTTTHKSLRGPRGAMIFYRRGARSWNKKTNEPIYYDLENPINFSVFPGHQGGPHNHTIAAIATALKQAATPQFQEYQRQVLINAKALESEFKKWGYNLVSNGTDSHMMLLNVRDKGTDGARVEYVCEKIAIVLNKNAIPGDKSALLPGGARIGTPAMTSRGMDEAAFCKIVQYIDKAINFAVNVQRSLPPELFRLRDFKSAVNARLEELLPLKKEIQEWAMQYPLPV